MLFQTLNMLWSFASAWHAKSQATVCQREEYHSITEVKTTAPSNARRKAGKTTECIWTTQLKEAWLPKSK